MDVPEVRYARSGDISVAYQLFGEGDIDLVVIRGSLSELESAWEQPLFVRHLETLGSFARVAVFDKRGTGLCDRLRSVPSLETRMDDIRVVMDAAGMEQAVLFAAHEGSRIAVLFAATYPERTRALVLHDPSARGTPRPGLPVGSHGRGMAQLAPRCRRRLGNERVLRAIPSRLLAERRRRRGIPSLVRPPHAIECQSGCRCRVPAHGDGRRRLRRVAGRPRADALSEPTAVGRRVATRYVAERVPAAEWREIPGLVDGYSWVNPDANAVVLAETETFLRGLASPSRARAPARHVPLHRYRRIDRARGAHR